MQLLTHVDPRLKELRKEGESGRRKITRYTRYGTVALALFQSLGVAIALEAQQAGALPVVVDPGWGFRITAVTTLVAGTIFLMWLGEQVSERGIGNGISIIIFAGIVAGLPSAIGGTLELARTGELHVIMVLVLLTLALAVTAFVVFVERGQRRITVNYARRQVGRRVYAGQTSHLPLKLNMARGDSADFCVKHNLVSRYPCGLVWQRGRYDMVAGSVDHNAAGAANLCVVVRDGNHFLLLLLHGVGVRPKGDSRQSAKIWCFYSWSASWGTDGALYRWCNDEADGFRSRIHCTCLLASGVYDCKLECAILFRRHVTAHHRGGDDGFHGTSAITFDVPSIRRLAEEGDFEGIWQGWSSKVEEHGGWK